MYAQTIQANFGRGGEVEPVILKAGKLRSIQDIRDVVSLDNYWSRPAGAETAETTFA